jgi:ATP-dependent DNA helicase RecG
MAIHLNSSVKNLTGIGKKAAADLRNLGVVSVEDLLLYFPYRYDDFSKTKPIPELEKGDIVTLRVTIQSIETRPAKNRRKLKLTEAVVDDGHGTMKAVWFNQSYLTKTLKPGTKVFLAGEIDTRYGLTMVNPIYEKGKEQVNTGRIVPVYGLSGSLTMRRIRHAMEDALEAVDEFEEWLPSNLVQSQNFPSRPNAIRAVHFPDKREQLDEAINRLKFEELFLHQLLFAAVRKQRKVQDASPVKINEDYLKTFVAALPFDLTGAQRRAAWDIITDCAEATPMNRLLEGDVGAGKTVVAAIAIAHLLEQASGTVAYLAPTEILAGQQFEALREFITEKNIGLLTKDRQSVSGESVSKEELAEAVMSRDVRCVVGTHALLQEGFEMPDLQMVVIDEQHRFGVEQRHALLDTGEDTAPHLLSMTATPIPRSLALTMYGDLDLSILDEMPAGRKPVATKVVYEHERSGMWDHVRSLIDEGQQVFVVCPLIDPSDKLGVRSVKEVYQELANGPLEGVKMNTLHGKLKPDKKERVIRAFRDHELDALVATTVVEVGVDIPNATVMVIIGAERFGLAQLHQLRGRVGRSDMQSYCYLLPEELSDTSKERLRAVEDSTDGFSLAERDLEMRGAGNVFGTSQSGFPDFDLATPADLPLINEAREWSRELLNEDPDLEDHPTLQSHVQEALDKVHME